MNEENEKQPVPTESASPEQRQHHPRRRFPRKRYRGRDDRFRRDDSESPNSSSINADSAGAVTEVETIDRPASGGREGSEAGAEGGEQVQAEPEFGEGVIEISGKGFGFLRDAKRNFVQSPQDIFVTPEVVRRFSLRDGMWLKGEIRRGNRGPQLFRLLEVNGGDPEKARNLPAFDELTVVSPDKRIKLETVPD